MGKKGIEKKEKREKEVYLRGYIGSEKGCYAATSKSVIVGIDPGMKGAIVGTDGEGKIEIARMPVNHAGEIHYETLVRLLRSRFLISNHSVIIERAIPMAMGAKGAFSFGRGYERILRALYEVGTPKLVIVEPAKWTKEMHQGISADLKPKAKSLIAAKKLFPSLVRCLPKDKKGRYLDGPIDALLIAGYGLREVVTADKDFF